MKPLRVLVVDDELLIAEMMTEIIESLGHTVTRCTDSADAIGALEKKDHYFDLIVTDLSMPEHNGFDVITVAKALNSEVKAILVTGHAFDERVKRRVCELACRLLGKPFDFENLKTTIQELFPDQPPGAR